MPGMQHCVVANAGTLFMHQMYDQAQGAEDPGCIAMLCRGKNRNMRRYVLSCIAGGVFDSRFEI